MRKILSLVLGLAVTAPAVAGERPAAHRGPLDDLYLLQKTSTRRISSYNPSGANRDWIAVPPGQTVTLASIEGAGIIRRFYTVHISSDRMRYRKLMLRMYWDGSKRPCVEVPFGEFFGAGLGPLRPVESDIIRVNPGLSGLDFDGMVSYLPMPFSDGARITITNDGGVENLQLWFHIDYEVIDPSALPANAGRLHASWRREALTNADDGTVRNSSLGNDDVANTSGTGNFSILEAKGHGRFVGFFLTVDNIAGGWWGEGDDMIFIDGARWPPTYAGTGSEEVFNAGCCPDREFSGPDSGFYLVENRGSRWGGKNQMYRFYLNDPVHFRKSILATIEHGHANSYENDYSATAFWYQTDDHLDYPPVLDAKDRIPRWSPRVRTALRTETEIRDVAMASLIDETEFRVSEDFKRSLRSVMTEASRAFRAFDEDAYVDAVESLKSLMDTLPSSQAREKQMPDHRSGARDIR